jgi:hypothetical protein
MPSIAYLDVPSANLHAQPLNPGNHLIVIDAYALHGVILAVNAH